MFRQNISFYQEGHALSSGIYALHPLSGTNKVSPLESEYDLTSKNPEKIWRKQESKLIFHFLKYKLYTINLENKATIVIVQNNLRLFIDSCQWQYYNDWNVENIL